MILTDPQSQVFYQFLVDQGIGTDPDLHQAWPVYKVGLPGDKPDNAINVMDTEPLPDGRLLGMGERIEHPGIMVQIRALYYPDGWAKAKEIADQMDVINRDQVMVESTIYLIQAVSRQGGVNHIRVEELRRREYFTVNALLTISEP